MLKPKHIQQDHLSFYVSCPADIKLIWFMLAECNNGLFYLKEEFHEDDHLGFEDITPVGEEEARRWFPSRAEGLSRALEIIKAIRPKAITFDLEEEIRLYQI